MSTNCSALYGRELPRWIRDLLASPPAAGTGIHQWLFRVACALKAWRSDPEIAAILTTATLRCGRDVSREIHEAIRNAPNNWEPGIANVSPLLIPPRRAKWPGRNLVAIEKIARGGAGLADLWEMSPIRLEGNGPDAEEIIDLLFPKDALLCVATRPQDAVTRSREEWRGELNDRALIVPSVMTARTGISAEGGISNRCLNNTGTRRFLVVEFDFKARDSNGKPTPEAPLLDLLSAMGRTVQDLCAALLLRLGQLAPLILAVHSGGKSLHGWFPAEGVATDVLSRFFRLAVIYGADSATWTRCQLIRLPEGLRENGKRQRIWYFDPKAISNP